MQDNNVRTGFWASFWDSLSGAKSRREHAAAQAAYQAHLAQQKAVLDNCVSSGRQIHMICGGSNVDIHSGEQPFCVLPGTALYEPRQVRTYVGGSNGVSFRVAKGVTVRTGAYRGHAEYSSELRQTDTGDFIITSSRLVFAGGQRTVVMDFDDIVATEVMTDGMRVNKAKRDKPFIFGFDTSLGADIDGVWFNATGEVINIILGQAKLMRQAAPVRRPRALK